MNRLLRSALALAALVALLSSAAVALADATVLVTVTGEGEVPEGRVVLSPRSGGESHSCQTENRRCRIEGVPSGSYTVRFEPATGTAPRPQSAMIGGEGPVRLDVYGGDHR